MMSRSAGQENTNDANANAGQAKFSEDGEAQCLQELRQATVTGPRSSQVLVLLYWVMPMAGPSRITMQIAWYDVMTDCS